MKCWEWGDIDEKVMINLLPFFFFNPHHTRRLKTAEVGKKKTWVLNRLTTELSPRVRVTSQNSVVEFPDLPEDRVMLLFR